MKCRFLFLCLLFITAAGHAQKEFFPEGTHWTISFHNSDLESVLEQNPAILDLYPDEYKNVRGILSQGVVRGDTVISGLHYRKVTEKLYKSQVFSEDRTVNYYALREEGGRVFIIYYGDDHFPAGEVLYYDFNWEKGKEVALHNTGNGSNSAEYIKVDSVWQIRLNDGSYCDCTYGYGRKVIRTIGKEGSMLGLFYPFDLPQDESGNVYYISSFVRNGVCIYGSETTDIGSIAKKESQSCPMQSFRILRIK